MPAGLRLFLFSYMSVHGPRPALMGDIVCRLVSKKSHVKDPWPLEGAIPVVLCMVPTVKAFQVGKNGHSYIIRRIQFPVAWMSWPPYI
jgi:hypothetical protein